MPRARILGPPRPLSLGMATDTTREPTRARRRGPDGRTRCSWVTHDDVYVRYHDEEWGVPVHDDRRLFEFLVLETFQAGLSWLTVLRKRENFRRAFDGFDPERVARYGPERTEILMSDAGIIRNRAKIEATVANAAAFLRVQEEEGGFAAYSWRFVGGSPRVNRWHRDAEVPASSPESIALASDLRRRGFRFVGPTVAYAHMQATGMVMDHAVDCFRHAELAGDAPRAGSRGS